MTDLLPLLAAAAPSWDAAPTSLQRASVPIFALLAIVVTILLAVALVRAITGRSLDNRDDD